MTQPSDLPPPKQTSAPLPPCEGCGKDADVVFDGVGWCASCIHARGSCCAESDMTDPDDEPQPRAKKVSSP